MPIDVLGHAITPLVIEDAQRVFGKGWLRKNPTSKWLQGPKPFGPHAPLPRDVYVLPQIGDRPLYAGSPCGVCVFKARRLGGGCEPEQTYRCTPVLDESAVRQLNALNANTRVSSPESTPEARKYLTGEHPLINPHAGDWPDEVPLLCYTVKSWVSTLDPNKDGRIQRAAYIKPENAYRVVTIPKADGRVRKLHVPCGALMELQSRILERTLNRCAWPEYVAAYVPGRQLLDTARRHAGKPIVITLDLKNFFGSTTYRMVHDALVETYGYSALGAEAFEPRNEEDPRPAVNAAELEKASQLQTYAKSAQAAVLYLTDAVTCPVDLRNPKSPRVLPQGAPTSGAFANLVGVHRLDPRVIKVCVKWGFDYSRYADDLIFSRTTDLTREETTEFIDEIVAAVFASGYRVNWKKLRVQRRHQQQRVLGLVVNDGVPKVPRVTRLKLRAQFHYAERCGWGMAATRNMHAEEMLRLVSGDVTPAEAFQRQHRGRTDYVRHIHEDHVRGVLNLTQQQWNGPGY
jgi:RNA-directed DNA polymerase